jgi:murein DD-endopeptidase MepM/ murein hydrolase activator NlpD
VKKSRLVVLLSFLFLFLASALPLLAATKIRVRGAPRQGDVLFVTIEDTSPDAKGSILWMGRKIPLSRGESGLQALLPIKADARPGVYPVKIALEEPEKEFLVRNVEVKKRRFATQSLWLSEDQLSNYDYPGVEREYDEIHQAFRRFSSLQAWKGPFLMPVGGPVYTSFGLRRFVNGESYGEHRGQDIAAGHGEPVRASNSGTVTLVREDYRLHGKTIILDHGQGVSTIYMHLSSISVREQDTVGRGAVIGKVGATGVSTGPHLHWGIYVQGEAINPSALLNPPREWLPAEAP